MGKTEIDRNAARFFLRQPIRIDAGERFDQRALAVIDVPGRCEDEMLLVTQRTRRNEAFSKYSE